MGATAITAIEILECKISRFDFQVKFCGCGHNVSRDVCPDCSGKKT